MKNLKLIALLVFASSLSFLASCSDDDKKNDPIDPATYYDFGVGSTWNYEEFDYDDNDQVIEESKSTYKTSHTGTKTIEGKTAFLLLTEYNDGSEDEEAAYSIDGSKLLALATNVIPSIGDDFGDITLPIPTGWVTMLDFETSSWTTVEIPLNDIDFPISDEIVGKLSGKLLLKGTKAALEQVTVNGTAINTTKFKLTFEMNANIKYGFFTIPFNFTIDTFQWWAANKGMVKTEQKTQEITIEFAGQSQTQVLNGYITNCISMDIK